MFHQTFSIITAQNTKKVSFDTQVVWWTILYRQRKRNKKVLEESEAFVLIILENDKVKDKDRQTPGSLLANYSSCWAKQQTPVSNKDRKRKATEKWNLLCKCPEQILIQGHQCHWDHKTRFPFGFGLGWFWVWDLFWFGFGLVLLGSGSGLGLGFALVVWDGISLNCSC